MTTKTKSQIVAEDIAALLRARNPLLWIVTTEEARVERYIFEAAAAAKYKFMAWDTGVGCSTFDGVAQRAVGGVSIDDTLRAIDAAARNTTAAERTAWVLRDLPIWIQGQLGATPLRLLRNLARFLPSVPRERAQACIVISPSGQVPDELRNHATVIEWPLPDRDEVAGLLDASLKVLTEEQRASAMPNGTRDAAIDAAIGLTGEEAQACFAKSLVQCGKVDPLLVASEKKRVIAREKVLEWFDPLPGGLDSVGGLEELKAWLLARTSAYSPAARAYGLPAPKGTLLVGIPGCGKSLTAKAVATAFKVPLLRMDLGALKSKFVGDSEANLRKALAQVAAIGRCVVWLDEIEKALQGATSGSADGGVSADALGAILSWMQERQGEAFVMATANDVSSLPPELLRKGRFDEVWFVDLPDAEERAAVLRAALKSHGRDKALKPAELARVAGACTDFTGSEIAALVPEAMFTAFNDSARELTADDLQQVAQTVTPLAKTAKEKIAKLRAWADEGRARRATRAKAADKSGSDARAIDL